MKTQAIRTLLVDDHAVVRSGYRTYLQQIAGFDVCGEAGSAEEAYRAYKELQPDIVIMDILMPGASGIEACRRILKLQPRARILVFSMHVSATVVRQLLDIGVLGVLGKDSPPETLCAAAAAVASGQFYLENGTAKSVVFSRYHGDQARFQALSPREFDITQMLIAGVLPNDIAETLNLSSKTVANLLSIIRNKLGVTSDVHLLRLAASVGLVPWIPSLDRAREGRDNPPGPA